MTAGRSVARRIAVAGAAAAALTALVSAAVPLGVLAFRLSAADARNVAHLAESLEAGIERERGVEKSLTKAASDVLDESALDQARMEVWEPAGLVAARGPGATLGPGRTPSDAAPHRERGRMVARRATASGLVISVGLPVSFSRALRGQMAYALLLAVVPLSVLAAAVVARLSRRALAPLASLAGDVAARRPAATWEPVVPLSSDAEITRLAEAFNRTGERLAAALSAERELAAYAAHALRTPLTRLAALTSASPEPVRRAVVTLQRLVDSLLVLVRSDSRLAEGGATLNAADLLRQVAARHEGPARELPVDAPDEALVRGDGDLLVAALEHLVENALAYAPAGTPVRLSVEESAGRVTLAVTDEGPGLAEGEAERLFDPFVRGRAAAGTDGSGLGLALVRRIAEGHGGSARALPAGAGTRFELVLPAWKPR